MKTPYRNLAILIFISLCFYSRANCQADKKSNSQLFTEWKYNMRQLRDKGEIRVLQLKQFKDSIPSQDFAELTGNYNTLANNLNSMLDAMSSDVKANVIVFNKGLVKLSDNYEIIRNRNAEDYAIFELKALKALKMQPAGGASFILPILSELGKWILDAKIQANINQLKDLKWRNWDQVK
jgi:hypothetical protein